MFEQVLRGPGTTPAVVDRSARWTSRACVLLALVLPAVTAAYLINGWPNALTAAAAATGVSLQLAAQAPWRLMAAGVLALLPVLAMALALLRASRCLRAFAGGQHFSLAAVRDLRGFAALVLLAGIACTLVPTLVLLLLTWGQPGQASLALNFGSQHLLLLLFAAVTWQIARVLAKAVALAEEHAQIV